MDTSLLVKIRKVNLGKAHIFAEKLIVLREDVCPTSTRNVSLDRSACLNNPTILYTLIPDAILDAARLRSESTNSQFCLFHHFNYPHKR